MFYTYTLLCFLYRAILQLQITGRGIRKRKTSTRHTTNWAHSLSNPGNYQPGAGQAQAGQDRRCSVAATAKCQWESVREKKREQRVNETVKGNKRSKGNSRQGSIQRRPVAAAVRQWCACRRVQRLRIGSGYVPPWHHFSTSLAVRGRETERSNWLQLVQVGEKSESVRKKPQISFSCHRKVHKMRNHSKKYINK